MSKILSKHVHIAALAAIAVLSLAACSTPASHQVAQAPAAAQQTDWLHEQVPLMPANIGDAGN